MMEAFRTFGASKASKAMLVLLVICFAGWGIGDYIMPSIGNEAVTVNGEKISPTDIETTYKQRLENISQLLGGRPTQEQLNQMQIAEQVVAEVVARTVLRQAAEALHFQPATKQLQDEIGMIGAFKNEQGQFDVARYRQILQSVGRTPQQFEHDLGQDIKVRNLANLSKIEMPSPSLVGFVAASEDVKLGLEVATFTPANAGSIKQPTQAELEKFHSDNQTLYSQAESRDLVVLRISRDEITKSITVPDSDIKSAYEKNKASYALPEMRDVRHILLDSEEEAKKVASGIKTQADFEKAANEFSQDPGNQGKGGTLGRIQEKDVVPAFGKVAFSIKAGELSAPVQSNFGWHLIWVDHVEAARSLPFDEVKDAIANDLQAAQAEEALVRLGGVVDEKITAGEPLSKIAADVGLKPLQFNMVKANDEAIEPHELEAGFGVQQGEVSVPLPMKDGGAAYVQAIKINTAKVLPLAEVKDRVAADWRKVQVEMALRAQADKLLSTAREPNFKGSLADAAAKAGISNVQISNLDVKAAVEAPNWLQRNLLDLFALPVGAVPAGAIKDGESWRLVRITSRESNPVATATLPEMAKVYQQRLQGDLEALLMAYLTQEAQVKLNQPMLKQMFGREVRWDITEAR